MSPRGQLCPGWGLPRTPHPHLRPGLVNSQERPATHPPPFQNLIQVPRRAVHPPAHSSARHWCPQWTGRPQLRAQEAGPTLALHVLHAALWPSVQPWHGRGWGSARELQLCLGQRASGSAGGSGEALSVTAEGWPWLPDVTSEAPLPPQTLLIRLQEVTYTCLGLVCVSRWPLQLQLPMSIPHPAGRPPICPEVASCGPLPRPTRFSAAALPPPW